MKLSNIAFGIATTLALALVVAIGFSMYEDQQRLEAMKCTITEMNMGSVEVCINLPGCNVSLEEVRQYFDDALMWAECIKEGPYESVATEH